MYSKLFKFDQICKTMIPDDLQIDYMTERATWLRELPWAVMFRQCQNQFAEHGHFWVTFGHLDATFWLVCARLFSKSVWIAGLRTWSKWTPNMKIWLSHVPHSKPRTPRRMHISSRPLTLTKSRLILKRAGAFDGDGYRIEELLGENPAVIFWRSKALRRRPSAKCSSGQKACAVQCL